MTKKALIVAKYEFLKTVKRKSFWISTLFMPVLMGIIIAVSALSSIEGEKQLENLSENIKDIQIIDESSFLDMKLIQPPLRLTTDLEQAKLDVLEGKSDAIIYYPANVIENGLFDVYSKENGLLGSLAFGATGEALLRKSAFSQITSPEVASVLNRELQSQPYYFTDDGRTVKLGLEMFIVPVFSIIVFFLGVFIAANYMLQSVSEEKENRMIENLLSMITSKTLIFGKIMGLSLAVGVQLLTWTVLSGAIVIIASNTGSINLPVDINQVNLSSLPLSLFFIFTGFLLFSAVMTGVGAVGTSYKDSQSLSSVFIILSIFPLYFITVLLADPNGVLAKIASYFPLTSAMVFILRNSFTEVPVWELLLGIILNLTYVVVAFILAIKLFNLGSLMYERRPSIKEILYLLRK